MEENLENQKKNTERINQKSESDWFLQTLVNITNTTKSKGLFGITLVTHGFLVSGQIASGMQYFEEFAKDFSSGLDDTDAAKSIHEDFIKMGKNVYDKTEKEENPPPPTFIHLSDAKFFHPNGQPIPANKGVWWRGRLSEISGFSLGKLSSDK